jgi:hypothetical protein
MWCFARAGFSLLCESARLSSTLITTLLNSTNIVMVDVKVFLFVLCRKLKHYLPTRASVGIDVDH